MRPPQNINRNAVLFFWSGQTGREPCLSVRQRVDLTSATWSNRHECPAAGVPHRARESLCAHHKISLTNAVSLRNFSATRSLVRSVAFFITGRKQKFPHEALREVWLFYCCITVKFPKQSVAFIHTKKLYVQDFIHIHHFYYFK